MLLGRSKSQDGGDKDKDLHRIFHKESTRTVYNHLLKRSVVTSFAAGRGPHQETQVDHDLHMNTVKLQGVLSHMTGGHDPAEAYWSSLTGKMLRLALLSVLATVAFSQVPCGE